MKSSDAKYNFIWIWINTYKCCFANVYFCIIYRMTLNLSSNFTLMAMYRSFYIPHYCGFKEPEIHTIYTVWMVIYWNANVNILIIWDTDFWLS